MGSQVQVLPYHDSAADDARPRANGHARHVLLLMWVSLVATPWVLQLRSFSAVIARHKIPQNLLPSATAVLVKTPSDVATHCPADGVVMADVWWVVHPTHYYSDSPTTSVTSPMICHFVVPQYNAHGMYSIRKHATKPSASAPRNCANDSYTGDYYFYHGSFGYYAMYSEGEGSYCRHDATLYGVTSVIGSSDINFRALAHYEGAPGYHQSYFFGCVGGVWLVYRGLVVTRSCRSCSRYGRRLDALKEPISLSSATVFAQQAARLAPHTATNWHRLGFIYLLVECLMNDLFLITAFDGLSTKLQYISLGYNIAGMLSMLFEMLENSNVLKPSIRLLVKRVLFNTEMALKGELVLSIAMSYFLTAVNRSDLGRTPQIAEAVSHYVWSLFNHSVLVLGHTAFILTVRIIGTLAYVQYRFGSLQMLVTPCCVDSVLGYRSKLVKISGYELHNHRLCFSRDALKAHGLFKTVDAKGSEYLVYHKIHWLPSNREDLAVLGKLTGEHVDPWPESHYSGPVATCDRIFGGVAVEDWARSQHV